MCGVVGIVGTSPVNLKLYNALQVLQHRGQDAAGIITVDEDDNFHQRKSNGMVTEVFQQRHMLRLTGNIGIGHTRYPTAGSSSAAEAQPFYVNSPYGIALAHNGNLINSKELKEKCKKAHRHVNTQSDSEVLLNILAWKISKINKDIPSHDDIFEAISGVYDEIKGGFSVVSVVLGIGMIAFRDPYGIRPLVLGEKKDENGKSQYMVASESVALDVIGFKMIRDVKPGEALLITKEGELHSRICAKDPVLNSCIFEYVYFARPDSVIDGASVYATRVRMGTKLAEQIKNEHKDLKIDVVIPIPDTSIDIAVQIARTLGVPYRQGYVKNRYVGRTFIMPGQKERKKSVRNKLNPIPSEFAGKNVLLVDDSIVRGTTSLQIVQMAREAGANKVYFASASPEIRYPNIYGIDMPTSKELIAYGRTNEEICKAIDADALIYQKLEDLEASITEENPNLTRFDCSIFTGKYVVPPAADYFTDIENQRSDDVKADKAWKDSEGENLDIFNNI
ncbi:amidophosphoribosyltransferase [Succinivibrio dextrinosolvens]|uniref:amidophosphoribosyltransferase n=1 Tax=Succinivibrio dextrinosolvens TaxID=83771 RepID=UPI0019234143|nr:amidophosphoribosyltransferase [Succinivibrio dextrinosolvens]